MEGARKVGGTKTLWGRSREAEDRRAAGRWIVCNSRCLRVKAAEKGVKTTGPLRWHFWVTEVETMRHVRFEFPPCSLGTAENRCMMIVIRVGLRCREYRRKMGHVEVKELLFEARPMRGHVERKDPICEA